MGRRPPALLIAGALLSAPWVAASPATAAATDDSSASSTTLEEVVVQGERAGPRLWKVVKGDHVLWIFGTLNHMPRHMTWRSAQVQDVMASSQELLLNGVSPSVDIGPITAIRLYFQWRKTQKNPNRSSLRSWLPAGIYARFESLKQRYDPNDSSIEELRPTFAAVKLYERAVDAAGLTQRDEVEQELISQAKHRRLPVVRAQLKIDDPLSTLKEAGELPPSVEVGCLDTTLARLETDIPRMQARANAWAEGDVSQLRALPFPNQREVCMEAVSGAPRLKLLIERAQQAWRDEAESALQRNRVTLAMRPIYDLLAVDGPLAQFRAEGYSVEGP